MVVAIHGDVEDFEKQALNPESYESEQVFFAYMASKDDLTYDELVELFYEYRGLFWTDEQWEKYE
jgi:hypothetical protein